MAKIDNTHYSVTGILTKSREGLDFADLIWI